MATAPVVLVAGRIVVGAGGSVVGPGLDEVAVGVVDGTGELDHVVRAAAMTWVGVGGAGVVGAAPGFHHVAAGVEHHAGDRAVRGDGSVLPALLAGPVGLVAVGGLLVVRAARADAGGGDVVIHPRRDQPGVGILRSGPGGVVGRGDPGRRQARTPNPCTPLEFCRSRGPSRSVPVIDTGPTTAAALVATTTYPWAERVSWPTSL